jgi:hypothetical protein
LLLSTARHDLCGAYWIAMHRCYGALLRDVLSHNGIMLHHYACGAETSISILLLGEQIALNELDARQRNGSTDVLTLPWLVVICR